MPGEPQPPRVLSFNTQRVDLKLLAETEEMKSVTEGEVWSHITEVLFNPSILVLQVPTLSSA